MHSAHWAVHWGFSVVFVTVSQTAEFHLHHIGRLSGGYAFHPALPSTPLSSTAQIECPELYLVSANLTMSTRCSWWHNSHAHHNTSHAFLLDIDTAWVCMRRNACTIPSIQPTGSTCNSVYLSPMQRRKLTSRLSIPSHPPPSIASLASRSALWLVCLH